MELLQRTEWHTLFFDLSLSLCVSVWRIIAKTCKLKLQWSSHGDAVRRECMWFITVFVTCWQWGKHIACTFFIVLLLVPFNRWHFLNLSFVIDPNCWHTGLFFFPHSILFANLLANDDTENTIIRNGIFQMHSFHLLALCTAAHIKYCVSIFNDDLWVVIFDGRNL